MKAKTKKSGRYKGTSKKGNFQEALKKAIAAARADISAELINWELYSVSGQVGGVVGANDLTVQIQAAGG